MTRRTANRRGSVEVFDDAGSNRGAIIISRMPNGISHSVPAFRRGRRKDGVGFYAVRSGPAIEFARSLRLLHFRVPKFKLVIRT